MNEVWQRIDPSAPEPVLRAGGISVRDVIDPLEKGAGLSAVARSLGLEPLDLVAALACAALGSDGAGAPPLVQSTPRHPRLFNALAEEAWVDLFPRGSRPARLALAAGLLQVHDFWEASHEAAQQADDLGERSVSAYWHGIAHRREPDAGNASYWFRRVGRHPAFVPLAEAARTALDASGDRSAAARLLPDGAWSPFAFIDLCSRARPGSTVANLARELQRLEMINLLGDTVASLS